MTFVSFVLAKFISSISVRLIRTYIHEKKNKPLGGDNKSGGPLLG